MEIRDPDDVPVVNAALAGGANAIVTGDRDLLADEALRLWLSERGVELRSPTETARTSIQPWTAAAELEAKKKSP